MGTATIVLIARGEGLAQVRATHLPVVTAHPSGAVVCRECSALYPCRALRRARSSDPNWKGDEVPSSVIITVKRRWSLRGRRYRWSVSSVNGRKLAVGRRYKHKDDLFHALHLLYGPKFNGHKLVDKACGRKKPPPAPPVKAVKKAPAKAKAAKAPAKRAKGSGA